MTSNLFSPVFWMYFSYVLSFIVPLLCGLTLLLIKRTPHNPEFGMHPRLFLGIIITLTGLIFIPNIIQEMYLYETGISILPTFDITIHLLFIPLYFLYFKKLTTPQKLKCKNICPHLLPVIIIFLCGIILFPMKVESGHNPGEYTHSTWNTQSLFRDFCLFLEFLYVSLYCFYILRLRKSYLEKIKENFSFIEGIDLKWVNYAIYLSIACGIIIFFSMIYPKTPWTNHLINISVICFIFYLFIQALNEPYIYYLAQVSTLTNQSQEIEPVEITDSVETSPSAEEEISNVFPPLSERYLKTLGSKKDRFKDELVKLFEQKKIYTQSTLSINDVANLMNTNRTYISNVINNEFGMSFYQFVNKYRIQEATILILERPEISIQEISTLVGFNSISSFITSFKLNEGITPKQWKQLYAANNE